MKKPISFYPLKPEEVLEDLLSVKQKSDKKKNMKTNKQDEAIK